MSPRLPETASLSEPTVQKIAREPPTPDRRWSKSRGSISGEVTYIRVRMEVWSKARDLAVHPSHIQVLNSGEVIVWNHGPPWPDVRARRTSLRGLGIREAPC